MTDGAKPNEDLPGVGTSARGASDARAPGLADWLESLLTRRGLQRVRRNYGILGLVVLGLGLTSDITQVFGHSTLWVALFALLVAVALVWIARRRGNDAAREKLAVPMAVCTALGVISLLIAGGQKAFAAEDRGLAATYIPPVADLQEILIRLVRIEATLDRVAARVEDIASNTAAYQCSAGLDTVICELLRLRHAGLLEEAGARQLEAVLLAQLRPGASTDDAVADQQIDALQATITSDSPADIEATELIAGGQIDAAFARLERAAREADREAAARWRRLGAIAYDIRVADSIAAYEHALETEPDDFSTRLFLFRQYLRSGRLEDAAQLTQSLRDQATDARSQATALAEIGNLHLLRGELGEAMTAYAGSLSLTRGLVANTGDAEARRELFAILNRIAELHERRGALAEALAAYSESRDIARGLAANPGTRQAQRDLSVSLIGIGDIQSTRGELDAAMIAYTESLNIARTLATGNASPQARRDLYISLIRIGDTYDLRGALDAALAAYTESLVIARSLAADTSNTGAQSDLSASLIRVGDIHLVRDELAAAMTAYTESLAITRGLASADPRNAAARRDLFVSLNKVGEVQERRGALNEALAAYAESRDIARSLAADPANAQAQRDLAVSLIRVGDIHATRGALDDAMTAYAESLTLTRTLASDRSNPQGRRDLFTCLIRIGDIQAMRNAFDDARATYAEGLDITRGLATDTPGAQAWNDLSVSLSRIGQLESYLGDYRAAAVAFREAVRVSATLVASAPDHPQWPRELADLQDQLAEVEAHIRAGD